jgi:hypothetical protein
VARVRDWIDLGRNTISSLTSNDVTNLYSLEWPEARRILIAEHGAEIEAQQSRLKRFLRTWSAVSYGLAKRLAPSRRVTLAGATLVFGIGFVSVLKEVEYPDPGDFAMLALSFLALVFLLAMELIDKLKYRDELVLARELQATLVPAHPPQPEGFEIGAFSHIANTVGGDIYDFAELPDGRIAVLFGDASGHGMAAGLVMAVAHAAFRTQLDVDASPAAIMSTLNRTLCRTGTSRSFFACCYLLLERDGRFVASVAGHPSILVVGVNGEVRDHVGRGAYPLGIKPGLTWEEAGGVLSEGERLVFHSDGLTETRNRDQREFGDGLLEAIVGWNPGATAHETVETIVAEWRTFSGGQPAEDDVSIAVVRRSRLSPAIASR